MCLWGDIIPVITWPEGRRPPAMWAPMSIPGGRWAQVWRGGGEGGGAGGGKEKKKKKRKKRKKKKKEKKKKKK